MKSFPLISFCIAIAACQHTTPNHQQDEDEIMSIMNNQISCWNKGDLDCFMAGYWHSDSVMYIGGSGLKYGYQTALDNYKKNYPNEAARGILNFDILELLPVADDAYFMVGKFYLKRTIGDAQGHFSLLFRKINGKWVIVADHSSATSG